MTNRCEDIIEQVLADVRPLESIAYCAESLARNIRSDTEELKRNWNDDNYKTYSKEVSEVINRIKSVSAELKKVADEIVHECHEILNK